MGGGCNLAVITSHEVAGHSRGAGLPPGVHSPALSTLVSPGDSSLPLHTHTPWPPGVAEPLGAACAQARPSNTWSSPDLVETLLWQQASTDSGRGRSALQLVLTPGKELSLGKQKAELLPAPSCPARQGGSRVGDGLGLGLTVKSLPFSVTDLTVPLKVSVDLS